ncbi:MAG TPA: methyltransferase domain-containing protein [Rhizomicrobium sp.]|jgi:ubiquinone/menaquinone biosynthesis C-methylase UbiE|nr:methyltransferase domain-containing protein [Rhizomicrobium sp.]
MSAAGAPSAERAYRCPVCGQLVAARIASGDACPHCAAPARVRSLPVLLQQHLADQPPEALREALPALCFAPLGSEREILHKRFAHLTAVTLYGDYGADVARGVDGRDLSRFADGAFSGHVSIALFDYFTEQEQALGEAWRVLAQGGVFATLILDARVRDDAAPPQVVKKIEKRPGYYDYWPDGVDLLSVGVGQHWLVRAIQAAGFVEARHIAIPDPISGYVSHWFVGRKPEPGRLARAIAGFKARLKPQSRRKAPERIAAVANCTLCGAALKASDRRDDCPSCRQPARTRGMPLVWSRIARKGARFAKPLLGFALSGAERPFLAPYFPSVVSASLYGDYGTGHITGVDVRDLSRFEDAAFSGVFSILLFDYFAEHEQALAEVARVLEPGGLFVMAMNPGRVSEGAEPPAIIKTIQSRPGYFDYVPPETPLSSVHVGGEWFAAAMERAGFAVRRFTVADALAPETTPWFVGVKR